MLGQSYEMFCVNRSVFSSTQKPCHDYFIKSHNHVRLQQKPHLGALGDSKNLT